MAGLDDGKLNNRHYTQLAEAISGPNMETIAQGYLDIDPDLIVSIKQQHLNRATQSNMDILRRWANRNDGPQQRKILAQILYEAADDAGYINPCLVEKILGYTQQQANTEIPLVATSAPDIVRFHHDIVRFNERSNASQVSDVSAELTIALLLKISKRIRNDLELYALACIGLGLGEHVVDSRVRNNSDIHVSAFHVLKHWRQTQNDARTAYLNMCKALRHDDVNMASHFDAVTEFINK